jgi:hypothetical protein
LRISPASGVVGAWDTLRQIPTAGQQTARTNATQIGRLVFNAPFAAFARLALRSSTADCDDLHKATHSSRMQMLSTY